MYPQPIVHKALSWGAIRKSVCILAEITIRKSQDNAVASAYGWIDLDLGHGFHEAKQGIRFTISEAARRNTSVVC